MHGQVIGIATLQITGGQSVNFAIPSERISQLQIGAPMTLAELVVASGRNKRAKAVQFFRDGLSFLSKDDCEKTHNGREHYGLLRALSQRKIVFDGGMVG